ncbi:MAG TPA: hypothetical protein VGJ80_06415 [Gemmatimonadales bacterium]
MCSYCGDLLGPDDTVKRVLDKHSQLERFGLAGPLIALLAPKPRPDR